MKIKPIFGVVTFFMFVFGIFFMIVAESVDFVFVLGLLFFIIGIIIAIFEITWRITVGTDEFFRRHLKLIIILVIIVLALIPTVIGIFAGVFFVLLYYTYRKQTQTKTYEQNEYEELVIEEMK